MVLSRKERAQLRALTKARHRTDQGRFVVSGVRAVQELLASVGSAAVGLAVTSPRVRELAGGAALLGALAEVDRVEMITDEEMSRIAPTASHQGVIVVCELPHLSLADVDPAAVGVVLVLDGVQDPGNVGTLVRAAAAFDCSHVVVLDGSADPFGPKAVRSAAGMVMRLPVLRTSAETLLEWVSRIHLPIWVADADGEPLELEPVRSGPLCLILGGEGKGVRPSVRMAAARVVRVDMSGPAESLNVAMAGSILLHAFDTQLRPHPGEKDNR